MTAGRARPDRAGGSRVDGRSRLQRLFATLTAAGLLRDVDLHFLGNRSLVFRASLRAGLGYAPQRPFPAA